MGKAFDFAKQLFARNATHRRGHRIADQTPIFHAEYAAGECQELIGAEQEAYLAHDAVGMFDGAKHRAHQLEELADAQNCLDIYAVSKGFTEEEIEVEQLRKLSTRFDTGEK